MGAARFATLGLVTAWSLVSAQTGPSADEVKKRLVGNWTLVNYESFDERGNPTGRRYDEGRIVYDEHGNMAAQLRRKGRPVITRDSTDADRLAASAGYVAYYGLYQVDAAKGVVLHQVHGSTITSWEGTTLIRYYEFSADGNTLKLSLKNGERVTGTLTWERIR